jgi:hypothetical protein
MEMVLMSALQAAFLTILPRIETHALISFRDIHCPDTRADKIAECRGLAWKWFVRLAERGKDARCFPTALARFAVLAVRSGRRVTGLDRAKDVFSARAQRKHGFTVERLPNSTRVSHESLYGNAAGQRNLDVYEERLADNTVTPPPDQAAFRIDWPLFLKTLPRRDRQLAKFLSLGHSNQQAAEKFGLSQGRVSQLRKQWCREWKISQGECNSRAA